MELENKIRSKKAVIGIIGLGYVGLPLVMEFARKKFKVVGFDVDAAKTKALNAGKSYIKHIPSRSLKAAIGGSGFEATTDYRKLKNVDAVLICVPTPLTKQREPDLSYVTDTCESIAPNMRKGQLIVLESTTYPGTTAEVMLPILEKSGLKVGKDFYLAYSPEREDPNNKNYTTATIPKVVGGHTPACRKVSLALYEQIIVKVVPVSSTQTAEATKLVENIFRCVNIALVNELKLTFTRMGIDVWEVIEAAKTKPFGFMPFYPGPGLGGHCIPIDPFYLTWKAREYDMPTRFIELAGEINTSMPYYVVDVVREALNSVRKSLRDAKVLVLGLAYKKDIDDLRESPSLKLMELLEEGGARVDYNDPYIPATHKMREYNFRKKSVALTPANLKKYDVVLISTDHSEYDYAAIAKVAGLVVDARNACRNVRAGKAKIWKA